MTFRHRMSTLEELVEFQRFKNGGPAEKWRNRANAWMRNGYLYERFAGLSDGISDGLLMGSGVQLASMTQRLLSMRIAVSPETAKRIRSARITRLEEWLCELLAGGIPIELRSPRWQKKWHEGRQEGARKALLETLESYFKHTGVCPSPAGVTAINHAPPELMFQWICTIIESGRVPQELVQD